MPTPTEERADYWKKEAFAAQQQRIVAPMGGSDPGDENDERPGIYTTPLSAEETDKDAVTVPANPEPEDWASDLRKRLDALKKTVSRHEIHIKEHIRRLDEQRNGLRDLQVRSEDEDLHWQDRLIDAERRLRALDGERSWVEKAEQPRTAPEPEDWPELIEQPDPPANSIQAAIELQNGINMVVAHSRQCQARIEGQSNLISALFEKLDALCSRLDAKLGQPRTAPTQETEE